MNIQQEFELRLSEFKRNIIAESRDKETAGFLLFKDYLHRLNQWYKALDLLSSWDSNLTKKEGHDLIKFISSELSDKRIQLEDFRMNYLNDVKFDNGKYRGFEYIFIYYYLYWEIFKDCPQINIYKNLPNPYESVIKILLMGNHIYKGEIGTIEIDGGTIRLQVDFQLPSLENDFLDYIDEKCERIGSWGIPNKERVEILWQEFQAQKK